MFLANVAVRGHDLPASPRLCHRRACFPTPMPSPIDGSTKGSTRSHGVASRGSDHTSPYEVLHANIDEVIAEWKHLVKAEPWAKIAPARLVDALPEILPSIFRLAGEGATVCSKALSDQIATSHGFFRREDGLPLSAVAEEWAHIKRACWKVLRQHQVDEIASSAVLRRLDSLIDDAIGYSLRGYYAPELDALRGRGLERRAGILDRRANLNDRRERS
jgi:hypothetical protein